MSVTTEAPRRRPSPRTKVALGIAAVLAIAAIVIVSILTGGSVATNPCSASSTLVGTRVTAFSESGLVGGTTVWAPWARHRDAVVIFFASWCGPCQREMPKVAAYLRSHSLGVQVIGVDALDARGAARSFVSRDRVAFPVAFDPQGDVTSGAFQFQTLPETAFVRSTGRVAAVYYGAIPTRCLVADAAAMTTR